MNAKISVFVTCVEEIIYLSLINLQDCTFKVEEEVSWILGHLHAPFKAKKERG